MKILLTTHQLTDFAGTEIYTFELAKALTQLGHQITIYSKYLDVWAPIFTHHGLRFVTNLADLADEEFDVAHVQHNINALEIRHQFPKLPIFYLAHGTSATFLETPPQIDLNITSYGAVSKLVKKSLIAQKIPKEKIYVVNNIVSHTTFFPTAAINDRPKKALIISNHMDQAMIKRIYAACQKLQIEVKGIGASFKQIPNHELPAAINQVDLVFTLGRGVVETMLCGRIPFVFDHHGFGDGVLCAENVRKSAAAHFSGKWRHQKFTVKGIVTELKKYDPAETLNLHQFAMAQYAPKICAEVMTGIYQETIDNYLDKPIDLSSLKYLTNTINITRLYTFSRGENQGKLAKLRNLKKDFPYLVKAQLSRSSWVLPLPILNLTGTKSTASMSGTKNWA